VVLSLLRFLFVSSALTFAFGATPATPRKTVAARKASAAPSASLKASATVRRWMKGMTLRDEVAQLVFVSFHGAAPNSRSREYRRFMAQIRDTKVG